MKRKLLVGALMAICLSILAYGTTAYFSADAITQNTITAGNIEICLKDSLLSGDEVNVMPGAEIDKTIQVTNEGNHPAFIRVKIDKQFILADGIEGSADNSLISFDINKTDWTEKDGYYYYNTPLESGQTTKALLTKIKFSNDMDNLYQNSKSTITTYASAVQSENNGIDATSATGWPSEKGGIE